MAPMFMTILTFLVHLAMLLQTREKLTEVMFFNFKIISVSFQNIMVPWAIPVPVYCCGNSAKHNPGCVTDA